MTGAFDGVRVVDASERLSGAYCARLFGYQGADVVLMESEAGSPLRHEPPFLDDRPGEERSLVHASGNASKRSVVLQRDDPRRARLLSEADIVVVSDGATAEQAAETPGCVVVAVTPYGLDTPMSERPGNDLITAALSGWALTNALDDSPPLRPIRHQSSYVAGVMAYTGGAAALLARDLGAKAQTVDVSELEPMLWMAAPSILAETSGAPKTRPREQLNVFNGPIPASDGHISLTFSRPHFWTEAMRVLGLDDLGTDPRYLDRSFRQAESVGLAERIQTAVAARFRRDLFQELIARKCTVGLVLDMSDLANDEHLAARGVLGELKVDGRVVASIEAPCLMSETPWHSQRSAPRLGQHTAEVLDEWGVNGSDV